MNTLIVSYLPKQEHSNTKKLLDTFMNAIKNTEHTQLDLLENTPDLFNTTSMSAYIKRNYMGQPIDNNEKNAISKMDQMTQQFKEADTVVLAFPMHNFSVPAPVKAYLDSIIQKGETFDMNEQGFVGLMKGKKALVIMTSGGVYKGQTASWEHGMSLTKQLLTFMGFENVQGIMAQGTNNTPENVSTTIENAQQQVIDIANQWFN